MRTAMPRVEPLLAFFLVGSVLLTVDRVWMNQEDTVPNTNRVVVTPSLLTDVRTRLTWQLEREPTGEELTTAVEAWINDEVLVREALARDLHLDDAIVRAHLAQKMLGLLDARAVAIEPDEAALRNLYEQRRDAFVLPASVTLRQVFLSHDRADRNGAAAALLARLQTGEDAVSVALDADPPPGGPTLRRRSPDRLSALLGPAFVAALPDHAGDAWYLLESTLGTHLVRIEELEAGRRLSYEESRERLRVVWQADERRTIAAGILRALRQTYVVEGWP